MIIYTCRLQILNAKNIKRIGELTYVRMFTVTLKSKVE